MFNAPQQFLYHYYFLINSIKFDPVFILKRQFRQQLNSLDVCTSITEGLQYIQYLQYEGNLYSKGPDLLEEAKLIFA
jgi:hypothetical protein